MRLDIIQSRPSLLMLSDRFPDPQGSQRAQRAWRLLCCASVTHRVYLSAVADQPVNLRLWREVARRAQRVHISSSSRRWITPTPYSGEAVIWTQQRRFDALLVTTPNVWPNDAQIDTDLRLCDLCHDTDLLSQQHKEPSRSLGSLLLPTRWRNSEQIKLARALSASDVLMVDSDQQVELLGEHRTKAVSLPLGITQDVWTGLFNESRRNDEIAPPMLTVLPVQPTSVRQAA